MDGARRGNHAHPVTPFGRLIREQRERRRMSLDDVVAAAAERGFTFTKSRLQQLETAAQFPTWPRAEIVKGISSALNIPERVLTLALLESMGLDLPQMPSSDWMLLVSKGERLSPREQQKLFALIEAWLPDDDNE